MIAQHPPSPLPLDKPSRIRDGIATDYQTSRESNPFWQTLADFETQDGRDLLTLTHQNPVLLIFLRHLGCTFCREALEDIASRRDSLEAKGILPVFVHMSEDEEEARKLFTKYRLADCPRVSDPRKKLYETFGLKRTSIRRILGPKVMWRGFVSAILKGHGFGIPNQDPLQLPGIFLLHRGAILKDFRHESPFDRPDYQDFEKCQGCP